MYMTKKNGFTTVELIVTFTLVSVITYFLLEIIIVLKNIYSDSGIRTNVLTQQALLSEKINYDFRTKKVYVAVKCGDTCARFLFKDGTDKQLNYDRKTNIITYGSFKERLINGSSFGNIQMTANTVATSDNNIKYDGILRLNIPIYNKNFEGEDFGINVVYQYNSKECSISGLKVVDIPNTKKIITLIGNENDISFVGMKYNDPGYYLYDTESKTTTLNDPSVEVIGNVLNEENGVYTIRYRYKDPYGGVVYETTRTVTTLKPTYDFKYTGDSQKLTIPVTGVYQIETWGASGGGTDRMKGFGGYTSATALLTKDDVAYIYVGGEGLTGNNQNGGFNGGGKSGSGDISIAGSGGGASDIRLNGKAFTDRIIVAGGGAGGGSRNDSSFSCYGGFGGGTTGGIGECSSDTYLGGAGTQTGGGAAASYTTNCTTVATAGSLGLGGNGASYSYSSSNFAGGGGGGGYYGGGGGSRYGGGGGGSGYCKNTLSDCNLLNGQDTFINPNNGYFEKGHNGNGYVRIKIISITN